MSGATIMAPMTVAVESATTPADAMTDARTRSTQNRVDERLRDRRLDEHRRSAMRSMSSALIGRSGWP